jgi:hypothetical protein
VGGYRALVRRPQLVLGPVDDRYERAADVAGPQPARGGGGGTPLHPLVEAAILGARGAGRSLPEQARQLIEQRLGADLRGVRVHTDQRADDLGQLLQARAFTTGQDIFFRRGEYRPRTLRHELAHVAQQQAAPGAAPAPVQRTFTHRGDTLGLARLREIHQRLKGSGITGWETQFLGLSGNRTPPTDLTAWAVSRGLGGVNIADLLPDARPAQTPTTPKRRLDSPESPESTSDSSPEDWRVVSRKRKKKKAKPRTSPTLPPQAMPRPPHGTPMPAKTRGTGRGAGRGIGRGSLPPSSSPRTPMPSSAGRGFTFDSPPKSPYVPPKPVSDPFPPLRPTVPSVSNDNNLPSSSKTTSPVTLASFLATLGPIPPERFYGKGPMTPSSPFTPSPSLSTPTKHSPTKHSPTKHSPTKHSPTKHSPSRRSPPSSPSQGATGPRRQPDGTYRDAAVPGRTLLLVGAPASGGRTFQIVETGRSFHHSGTEYRDHPGGQVIVPASLGSPLASPSRSPGREAGAARDLHRIASVGTYLPPKGLVQLHRVLAPYGPAVIRKTLAARSMNELQDVARQVNERVIGLNDRDMRALVAVKDSLTWNAKTGKKRPYWEGGGWEELPEAAELAEKAFYDYLGSMGEVMEQYRLERRSDIPGRREWVVAPHTGGSGAIGPDVLVVKKVSPDGYRVNPHEVKLTTKLRSNAPVFGYGDNTYQTDKGDASLPPRRPGLAPGGLPVLYRSNYRRNSALRDTPVKAFEYQREERTVSKYVADTIKGDKESGVPRAAGEKVQEEGRKADIRWKYATFGYARVDPDIGVPQTKLGRRSAGTIKPQDTDVTNPLRPWLDEMATWRAIGDRIHHILRTAAADLETVGKTTGPDADTMRQLLTELHDTLRSSKDWPHDELQRLGQRFTAVASPTEGSPGPYAPMAAKYPGLLARNMQKAAVRDRFARGQL